MPDIALDLRYLSYAILVAEHGSFRAAAESIDLAQSTVSRRVQLLEHRLGITLFERGRTGARLTPIGERFIRSARHGAEQLRLAVLDARQAQRGETGCIRIGAVTSLANGRLAGLLSRYRQAYPKIDLRIEEISNQRGETALHNKVLDVAFLTAEPDSRCFRSTPMWRERIVVALPAEHPLAGFSSIEWKDLRREVFILSSSGQESEAGKGLLEALGRCQASNVVVHGIGRDSVLGLVSSGLGIFATFESSAVDDRKVAFVPLADDGAVFELRAVWAIDNRNPAVHPFIELIGNHSI